MEDDNPYNVPEEFAALAGMGEWREGKEEGGQWEDCLEDKEANSRKDKGKERADTGWSMFDETSLENWYREEIERMKKKEEEEWEKYSVERWEKGGEEEGESEGGGR